MNATLWVAVVLLLVTVGFAVLGDSDVIDETIAKRCMYAAFAIMVIIVIVGLNQRDDANERAIKEYLKGRGYTVDSIDYHYRKAPVHSFWTVGVHRTDNPACGGDVTVERQDDTTVITADLGC